VIGTPPRAAPPVSAPRVSAPGGSRPPPAAGQSETTAAAGDPYVGLIAGPVHAGLEPMVARSAPGLAAVAVAAIVTIAGAAGRMLTDGPDPALLALGLAMPLSFLAAIGLAEWWTRRAGTGTILRFTVRATTATSTSYTLRGQLPAGGLQTGDLVRVVPGRRGTVRAVDVLATLNGPVLRRLAGRPILPPVQIAGFALAAVLLATTVILLLGPR
jgi:hypothetical protein